MRVDSAGHHQHAASIDELFVSALGEVRRNLADAPVTPNADVCNSVAIDVHDPAAVNQHGDSLRLMRLSIEFTIEPFVDGEPGPHVEAGLAAVRAADIDVEIGPFGTSATGEATVVLATMTSLCQEAMNAGAERISLQLTVIDPQP